MNALGASDRLFTILDGETAIPNTGGVRPSESTRGELQLRNVTFAYPTRKDISVLVGFSLTIRPGE